MGAAKANLDLYQGDDYFATVTVSNGGTPPDQVLAGYTAQAQIRLGPADTNDVLYEIAAAVNSPYIDLTIPATITATMQGLYVWDLQVTDSNGIITTLLAGAVTVTPEV